jgi:hypothetical protein
LQIADEVSRGRVAALPTPSVERADLAVSPELVVTHCEQAVINVELVGPGAGIEIDVIPVVRLEAMKRVPQRCFVGMIGGSHGDVASVLRDHAPPEPVGTQTTYV